MSRPKHKRGFAHLIALALFVALLPFPPPSADAITVADSCIGPSACEDSTSDIGTEACIGEFACVASTGDIGDGSCISGSACEDTTGTIGDNACQGDFACVASTGDIGDGSCISGSACEDTTGTIGDNACQGDFACVASTGDIGDGSCISGSACEDTTGTIGDNACQGDFACVASTGDIGDGSCNARSACEDSGTKIGTNACNGRAACYDVWADIGDGSCNSGWACDRLRSGDTVGNYSCNEPGACKAGEGPFGNCVHNGELVIPECLPRVGTVKVTKRVIAPDGSVAGDTEFHFNISCNKQVLGGKPLGDGDFLAYSNVPLGSACFISELDPGEDWLVSANRSVEILNGRIGVGFTSTSYDHIVITNCYMPDSYASECSPIISQD